MARVKSVCEAVKGIRGKINPYYDMTFKNMLEICDTYGGSCDAIGYSFQFGYLQGMKAARAEMKKDKHSKN